MYMKPDLDCRSAPAQEAGARSQGPTPGTRANKEPYRSIGEHVDNLRQDDSNAQIATLMDQLGKVTKERDIYYRALPYHNGLRQLDLPPAGNGFIPIQPLLPNLPPTPEEDDVIIPKASVLCHCSSPTSCASGYHDVKPNIWRAITKSSPSQALPHSYGIDFFVWPGLRERLIFSQHQYCNNSFWELLQTNLKIVWTDGFQDTFTTTRTRQYHSIATLRAAHPRHQRLDHVDGLLPALPELSEDIPAYMGIPASMGGVHPSGFVPSSRRRYEYDEVKYIKDRGRLYVSGRDSSNETNGMMYRLGVSVIQVALTVLSNLEEVFVEPWVV
ncbi:hypothetical protein ACKAV7_013307 [Fusarium commune]